MDRTVRALTDLSAVDDQLSGKDALMEGLDLALEKRRTALRQAVPKIFLAAYDARGRMGRRPAIVEAHGGHCSGCHLRLPPQLDSTIRRRESLCSCPHCGRLLYASTGMSDGQRAPESKHENGDRLAANVRKSKRARGVSGKRRHQEGRASKR